MLKQIICGIISSLLLLTLAGCGGDNGSDVFLLPATKTSATVKVSLNGSLGANAISGAGFTLTLPANVTPAMSGDVVATGVVTPSGAFAGTAIAPAVIYTPAAGAAPGAMQIVVASSEPAGVTTVGEIVEIKLQLINGAMPAAADFTLSNASVIDNLGAQLAGISAAVSGVTLK